MPTFTGATLIRSDAYYTPTDRFAGDVPEVGVTPDCPRDECPDFHGTCDVCGTGVCETHPAPERGVDTTATRGCADWAHESCHRQTCRDRDCWSED